MTKDELIKDLESRKLRISHVTCIEIQWLYENGYEILTPDEVEKINGMTVMAHVHGMNPFENNETIEDRKGGDTDE